jgi:hypothetical protein
MKVAPNGHVRVDARYLLAGRDGAALARPDLYDAALPGDRVPRATASVRSQAPPSIRATSLDIWRAGTAGALPERATPLARAALHTPAAGCNAIGQQAAAAQASCTS